jgi:restriction system protein
MAVPKHHEFRVPILKLLKDGKELSTQEFVEPMAAEFNISDEEKEEIYEKGKHNKFANRVFWALSYLNMTGLVTKPKRGIYKISQKGLELLKTPNYINDYIKEELKKRKSQTNDEDSINNETIDSNEDLTPEESLTTSFEQIKRSIFSEIIDIILSKSPREFENLVVQLLQSMGYGGQLKNSGIVTQYSNDGGIDGIIKEDVLGLGRIHIQAKRYKPGSSISREDIQKFVGALAVAQSNKGVFITTSNFSRGAKEYVNNLNATTTIVLINGDQLANYIYDYGLGMQTERVIEIKKLDSDFWDEMESDKIKTDV